MGFDWGGAVVGGAIGGVGGAVIGGTSGDLVPDVNAPTMSEEEKALIASQQKYLDEQAGLLQEYKTQLGNLYPILLAQSGYKEDESGKLIQMTQDEWVATMNPMQQAQYQLAMQQVQANNELLPLQQDLMKKQYQFQQEVGPMQQQLYKTYLEQSQLAAEGKLPIPGYLQEELDKQTMESRNLLSQRLGPSYYLSSPGIQTEDLANKRIAAIKEAYGHGEKQNAFGLLSGMSNVMGGQQGQVYSQFAGAPSGLQGYLTGNQAFNQAAGQYGGQNMGLIGGYGNLSGGYGSMMQPYQYYQGLGYNAEMQNAANQYGLIGDVLGLGGTIGGAAMGGK